jgi:hypothetical protein
MSLVDLATGRQLSQSGHVKVVEADGTAHVDVSTTVDGAYDATDSIDFSSGKIEFFTPTTVGAVDIYYITEKGYCGVVKNVEAGAVSEVKVDINRLQQTLLLPINAADDHVTAASEINTGIILPDEAHIVPEGLGIQVITADATETLDVGIDSTSGTDDPNGILEAISIATAANVPAVIGHSVGTNNIIVDVTGGDAEWTYGALMHPASTKDASKADGGDAAGTNGNGIYIFEPHAINSNSADNNEYLTYTFSAGSDTGAAILRIPLLLPQPQL